MFVYRQESRETIEALGLAGGRLPPRVPTVYVCDLTQPAGLFHAQAFSMHQEDVLYVSNAPETDMLKFLSVISAITGNSAAVRATVNP